MKNKRLYLFLAILILLAGTGCSGTKGASLIARARQNEDLLLAAVEEMRAFGEDRVYAALEVPKETATETETETGAVPAVVTAERLVRYKKTSDDHEPFENETVEKALRTLDFALVLYQTSSEGRASVIFSTGAENAAGIVRGVSFSFDGEPVAWWGRTADLKQHKGRWVEINEKGDAWYYTVPLENGFWYWEKSGAILG